jgi:hypothetical protein
MLQSGGRFNTGNATGERAAAIEWNWNSNCAVLVTFLLMLT